MLSTMPVHRPQIVSSDAASRRVSFAAEVVVMGDSETGVSKHGAETSPSGGIGRKVSFVEDVEIIGESEGGNARDRASLTVSFAADVEIIPRSNTAHRVSFAEDVEIIGKGNDRRSVAFADDVQVIGQSETPVLDENEAALVIETDALFRVDGSMPQAESAVDILIDEIDDGDELEDGMDIIDQDNANGPDHNRSAPIRLLAPPPRSSSLFWHGRPRTLRFQEGLVSPAMHIERSRPQSPPPPYADDELETDNLDDTEQLARNNPVPGYHEEVRPPLYQVDDPAEDEHAVHERSVYADIYAGLRFDFVREDHEMYDDIILENFFDGLLDWTAGVGNGVADAWRAFLYDFTGR